MQAAIPFAIPVAISLALSATPAITACATSTSTSTSTPPPAAPSAPAPPAFSTSTPVATVQIVHLGDSEAGLLANVDTEVGGLARARAIVDGLSARHPTVVLHAGDTFVPAPELQLEIAPPGAAGSTPRSKQKSARLIGNELLGVAATALGNHDLDLGESFAKDAITAARFPWVASTLRVDGGPLAALVVNDGTPWLSDVPGKIVRRGKACAGTRDGDRCDGVVVGVVGASPEDLRVITKGLKGVSTPSTPTETLAALAPHIDALHAEGIGFVVLLSHRQGVERDVALIGAGLRGVDVVISGGGENNLAGDRHRVRDGGVRDQLCKDAPEPCYPLVQRGVDGKPIVVVATEGSLRTVAALVVNVDAAGDITGVERGSRPWPVDEESLLELSVSVDKALLGFELAVRDALLPLKKVVGQTPVPLDGTRELVRNGETNLGSASADSLVRTARAVRPDTAFALRNAGGIRGSILGPKATLLDVQSALRFDSRAVVVELTHQQLKDTLEASLIAAGTTRGHFPQVSGDVTLTWSHAGADQVHTLKDGKVSGVERCGSRVVAFKVGDVDVVKDGRVLTPDARLALATIDYLKDGGDGWFPSGLLSSTPVAATEQSALIALLSEPAALQASLARTGRIVAVDVAVDAAVATCAR